MTATGDDRSPPVTVAERLVRAVGGPLRCTLTLAFAACCLLPIAAVRAEIPPLPDTIAPLGRAHPLIGQIIATQDGRRLATTQLAHLAARHELVLLGEKHDNPDHHRLQAWVIEALLALGRRPALALEMLDGDQAKPLAEYRAQVGANAAGLGTALGWQALGWPDWSIYAPIAEVALRADLPILPANLTRASTRAVGQGGLESLEPSLRDGLDASPRLDTAQSASLTEELRASHCGRLPDAALPRMSTVQWARDAHMAGALRDAARAGGTAVLIAGTGHVRTDRGVPWHLRRIAPLQKVLSVAFVEVSEGRSDPTDYGLADRFDVLWFTARVDDQDPCEKFGGSLRRPRAP